MFGNLVLLLHRTFINKLIHVNWNIKNDPEARRASNFIWRVSRHAVIVFQSFLHPTIIPSSKRVSRHAVIDFLKTDSNKAKSCLKKVRRICGEIATTYTYYTTILGQNNFLSSDGYSQKIQQTKQSVLNFVFSLKKKYSLCWRSWWRFIRTIPSLIKITLQLI